MLTHLNAEPQKPHRVIILGARGFVGAALTEDLAREDIPALPLGRQDVDLEAQDAGAALAARLEPGDTLVFASAKAPVKTVPMLTANLRMLEAVAAAIEAKPVAHVIYVSWRSARTLSFCADM